MPRSDFAPLGPYLRLLWNVAPPLLHAVPPPDGDGGEPTQPYISHAGLHLPAAPATLDAPAAARWHRAAAAHAAAHLVFSRSVFVRAGMPPITQALLGLLEDARAEALACRQLPGLRRLWAPWHTAMPAHGDDFETLMLRLARGLVDPGYEDPHPWVRKGRANFFLDGGGEVLAQTASRALRQLASALGHDIGQMRIGFNPRLYRPGPGYRDDNRWLWHSDEQHAGRSEPAPAAVRPDDASGGEAPPSPVQWRYPEWDARIGRERRDWCTVTEAVAEEGTERPLSAAFPTHRLAEVLHAAVSHARVPRSRETEGDEIDLAPAIDAMAALRHGLPADGRVYRATRRTPSSIAAFLLLDTSASSGQPVRGGALPTLSSTVQEAASGLAEAMSRLGWRVAVQGFSSDGRHAVRHRRVLGFGEPWDDAARRRLASLRAEKSTRIGAALRHAARALGEQPASRRLVFMVGDGEPFDVDVHERGYLASDARHALREARRSGIRICCLMPGNASAEGLRIFGPGASALLRDVQALPTAMARLLAAG